jgi:hypothetical protein
MRCHSTNRQDPRSCGGSLIRKRDLNTGFTEEGGKTPESAGEPARRFWPCRRFSYTFFHDLFELLEQFLTDPAPLSFSSFVADQREDRGADRVGLQCLLNSLGAVAGVGIHEGTGLEAQRHLGGSRKSGEISHPWFAQG